MIGIGSCEKMQTPAGADGHLRRTPTIGQERNMAQLIRKQLEEREQEILAPWAAHSRNSRGRRREEPEDDLRPVFQRDRDRILHSKSFRRLKDKTQVFITPDGDHYRTRMTHTLEVSQNARTIAKALRLNEDLTEAIALGHDLGHTPFGHAGERVLNRLCPEGFDHADQSVRLAEYLEKDGQGLNLTWEVLDGFANHQTAGNPATLEGRIVRYSDKIAYFHHDMDDAIRGGILADDDVPDEIAEILGHTMEERLDTYVHDIISHSMDRPVVEMSEPVEWAFGQFRDFMFERVYTNPRAKGEEAKAMGIVEQLYEYYLHHFDLLPGYLLRRAAQFDETKERIVCDYISSMTDRFAIARYEEIYVPRCWQ